MVGSPLVVPPYSTFGADALRRAFMAQPTFSPSGKEFSLYFQRKRFVVPDHSRYSAVTKKRYTDGARVLVRERWGNLKSPFTNYEFSLTAQ